MPETKRARHWRYILYLVGFVGFGILLYANREVLKETWELIKNVDLKILALMPIVQTVSYFFIASFYRQFLQSFKKNVDLFQTWGLVFAITFVNQILPSGGLSGISYLAYALRNVAPVGTVSLAQLTRYIFSYISYGFVLALSVMLLFIGDTVSGRAVFAGIILLTIMFVVAVIFWIIINSKSAIDTVVGAITRLVNWLVKTLRLKREKPLIDKQALKKTLNDFHNGVNRVRDKRGAFLAPLGFMILSTICELTIVNLAFVALGVYVNPGVVAISFAAANAVGVISIIPGDVGIHELTMIFVLSSAGVDTATAVSSTLLYRVFNKMTILPIGFFFYTRYLKPMRTLSNG